MKFMKLGTKPDTFHTEEATRTVISNAATDLIIRINSVSYLLHKLQYQLVPKSGLMQKLCSLDSESTSLEIDNIPGGEEAFEICAKFCYGITINLSAQNIVPSLCAAKFLRMTEAVQKGNLFLKLESFFSSCVLQGWKDSVLALQIISKVPEWSESLGIIRRCIDSVVEKILTPPRKVTWSYTYTRPGYNHKNRQFVPKDWWTEDISGLDIDIFRDIISAVESTKILSSKLIGEALHVYASYWLPNRSNENQETPESSSSASQSERKDTEKRILETIVRMIPVDKGSVSVGFLLRLLRISYVIVGTSPVTKAELVRLSSEKLEEATVNDLLLIYSCSDYNDRRLIYDAELVELLLESFVIQLRRRQQQQSAGLRSIRKIGKLVDSFLQVVAMEMNMPVAKFVSLAKALPESARSDHDDLYKAIHIYLAEHPDLGKAEKKQLCRVLDPQKLSRHVRGQAVRNEQLPLRIVVQLLFFEREEIQVLKPVAPMQTQFEHDQRIISHEIKESAPIVGTHHKTRQGVIAQEGSSGANCDNT